MSTDNTEFRPDYEQEHAGEYLNWLLETRGIKKVDFARRCGRPTKTISEIIAGKTAITPETALQFERVLGESASFWLALDANYQLRQARAKALDDSSTQDAIDWAKCFPVTEMVKAGFLAHVPKKTDLVDTLLRFFGVSSITAFNNVWEERLNCARFKQQNHHEIDCYAVAIWLRRGEIVADQLETLPYNEAGFRTVLSKIRSFTMHSWEEVASNVIEICKSVGVAVALVPSLRKTGLRGAAYWAHKDKAVIVLSDRGKYEERIWFAFFHEAVHILLHSKKAVFIDQDDGGSADKTIEDEADSFSAEFLIPAQEISNFRKIYGSDASYLPSTILEQFSREIGISAGLLLERLQYEGIIIQNSSLNKRLKRKVEFRPS